MPTGRLGTADLAAASLTTVYTVPAATVGSCTISMCNRTSIGIVARLALSATSTPLLSEYIEFDAIIEPNGVLERTGIALNAGMRIVGYAGVVGVSINVYGYEEVA